MSDPRIAWNIQRKLDGFRNIFLGARSEITTLAQRFALMDANNMLVVSNPEQRRAFKNLQNLAARNGESDLFDSRDEMYAGVVYSSWFFVHMCLEMFTLKHNGTPWQPAQLRFERLRQAQPSGRWARFFGNYETFTRAEERSADYAGCLFRDLGVLEPSFDFDVFVFDTVRHFRYIFVKNVFNCLSMGYTPWIAGIEGSRSETESSDTVKRKIGRDDVAYILAFGREIVPNSDDKAVAENKLRESIRQFEQSGTHQICTLPNTQGEGHSIIMYGHERQFITGDHTN